MTHATRWASEHGDARSHEYVERFRELAADGHDLAGEARLIDTLVNRNSRILDAGCGPGRVGADLAARGHDVVGVDADPILIEAAKHDHPGPRWLVGDLADFDLSKSDDAAPFDAAVLAGNVLLFVAAGTEPQVLERVAAHIRPDGSVVTGFSLQRGYDITALDEDARAAGLVLEHRFATWDLRPFVDDSTYAVSVFRRG